MTPSYNSKRWGWIVCGIAIGGLLSFCLPAQPLHAVATSGQDGFLLATGPIDNNIEGVYFLDGLTGELQGAAINVNNGLFTTFFKTNVVRDLQLGQAKNPKFLMVTGGLALRGKNVIQPGLSAIYVVELNSGVLGAYAVPWAGGRSNVAGAAPQYLSFQLLDKAKMRDVAVRPQ
jgi:hypothetical protein